MANPYGDVELDARGMRALAHPVRVRLLSELQRHGPSTATLLSPTVGASAVGDQLAPAPPRRARPGAPTPPAGAAAGSAGGRRPPAASGTARTAPASARRVASWSRSSRRSRATSSGSGTARSSRGRRRVARRRGSGRHPRAGDRRRRPTRSRRPSRPCSTPSCCARTTPRAAPAGAATVLLLRHVLPDGETRHG